MKAGAVAEQALLRARDPAGTSISSPDLYLLLSEAQRLICLQEDAIYKTIDFPLEEARVLYSTTEIAEDISRVVEVVWDGKSLVPLEWGLFTRRHPRWLEEISGHPGGWMSLGRELLAIWPAVKGEVSVTIRYVPTLANVVGPGDDIALPLEYIPKLIAQLELMLLLRRRDVGRALAVMKESQNG